MVTRPLQNRHADSGLPLAEHDLPIAVATFDKLVRGQRVRGLGQTCERSSVGNVKYNWGGRTQETKSKCNALIYFHPVEDCNIDCMTLGFKVGNDLDSSKDATDPTYVSNILGNPELREIIVTKLVPVLSNYDEGRQIGQRWGPTTCDKNTCTVRSVNGFNERVEPNPDDKP